MNDQQLENLIKWGISYALQQLGGVPTGVLDLATGMVADVRAGNYAGAAVRYLSTSLGPAGMLLSFGFAYAMLRNSMHKIAAAIRERNEAMQAGRWMQTTMRIYDPDAGPSEQMRITRVSVPLDGQLPPNSCVTGSRWTKVKLGHGLNVDWYEPRVVYCKPV